MAPCPARREPVGARPAGRPSGAGQPHGAAHAARWRRRRGRGRRSRRRRDRSGTTDWPSAVTNSTAASAPAMSAVSMFSTAEHHAPLRRHGQPGSETLDVSRPGLRTRRFVVGEVAGDPGSRGYPGRKPVRWPHPACARPRHGRGDWRRPARSAGARRGTSSRWASRTPPWRSRSPAARRHSMTAGIDGRRSHRPTSRQAQLVTSLRRGLEQVWPFQGREGLLVDADRPVRESRERSRAPLRAGHRDATGNAGSPATAARKSGGSRRGVRRRGRRPRPAMKISTG